MTHGPQASPRRDSSTTSGPPVRSRAPRTGARLSDGRLGDGGGLAELGDFTTGPRVVYLAAIAGGIGVLTAFVALALLRLIGLCTNLFFYQRLDLRLVSPAANQLGLAVVLVPVAGALIIGVMARYGSDRIRGHGIPEAIEAILIHGSRVQPRVAILKPLSSAISIGSGGPFGAEGPIIMTGGACGSLVAQFLHLTSAERKTLLVAGAAGGMSATFATPVAAVMLAVELLLFEWKPRSLIPVALASATAAAVRHYLLGPGPLFPTPPHAAFVGPAGLLGCVLVGLGAGLLSTALTAGVYAAEDAFGRLPIHWMWWPAIGGLVVGLGGLIFPPALGVGYDTIGVLLGGDVTWQLILGVLLVKSTIWIISLGSGTSGGVLAPLLMMGGALGSLASLVLPSEGAGFWSLVSMGAILGGTMRSPFTGVVFALELTHDVNALLPLLVAAIVAHGCTVLTMRRSILTEKVSRRGHHLTREYAADPLEIVRVREATRGEIVTIPASLPAAAVLELVSQADPALRQGLYPVVDAAGSLVGAFRRTDLRLLGEGAGDHLTAADRARTNVVTAYPDEPVRVAVDRMARAGVTRLPVVKRSDCLLLVGLLTLSDVLRVRSRLIEAEERRERVFAPWPVAPRFRRVTRALSGAPPTKE